MSALLFLLLYWNWRTAQDHSLFSRKLPKWYNRENDTRYRIICYMLSYIITIVLTILSMYFIGVSDFRVLPLSINEIKYRVFQKSSPPQKKKNSCNIFASVKSFRVKFCKLFCWHSYPQRKSANFCTFCLNISSNGANFSTSTHRFHSVKFSVSLFTQKIKMQLFGNDVMFSSLRVSQCSIIVNNR